MSATIRRYIAEREDFEYSRGFNEIQLAANNLRVDFLKKFIVGFDTNLYKTQEQRDWAYVAKREYTYDVTLKSLGYSIMASNLVFAWRVFVRKSMVFWPLAVVPATYFFFQQPLLQKHAKKLFDMCNLGEDFYLGQKRNQVLRECNRILDVEDF